MSAVRLDLLAPPFFAAAALLVASGGAKLRHPRPAGRALAHLGLPSGRGVVRLIGAVEIGVGMGCLVLGTGAPAIALAILYGAFAVFLGLQMSTGNGNASCGCFGRHEAPASLLHLGLNVAAAAIAALVSAAPSGGLLAFSARFPLGGLPVLVGTLLIAYLAFLAVAYLPGAFWSYGRPAPGGAAEARRFDLRTSGGDP